MVLVFVQVSAVSRGIDAANAQVVPLIPSLVAGVAHRA